jgi:hypothetical protein
MKRQCRKWERLGANRDSADALKATRQPARGNRLAEIGNHSLAVVAREDESPPMGSRSIRRRRRGTSAFLYAFLLFALI